MRPNTRAEFNPRLTGLSCFDCGTAHDHRQLQTVCKSCGMPLRVEYRLESNSMPRSAPTSGPSSLWRYRAVLPLASGEVSLVEGWTPLIEVATNVWIKDEARNPSGSFKARGMCAAVSVARALGVKALAAPSAGNAAGALAAYGAAAGIPVTVVMPDDTPSPFIRECELYGATVHLVRGTIADAGKWLKANGPANAFDVSTLKEPYRIEGKKTMAYELYEQMGGSLPDVIVYPTGGGTGLVGMWKAFQEMRTLGWLGADAPSPRMVSVQAAGCAPVVRGLETGAARTEPWENAHTAAYGLRVPSPIGGFICLRAIRESGGTAIAIDEARIGPATRDLASKSGIDVCPEGGAGWAALATLRERGWVRPTDRVVLFNTGTGLKYR